MNIWDYQYEYKRKIKLVDKDGDVFIGKIIDIMGVEEMDSEEARVTLETNNGPVGFWESDIDSMEIIEDIKG